MISFRRRPQLGHFMMLLSMVMLVLFSARSFAHPADVQNLRIKLLRDRAQLRFTFNLLILSRFLPNLDANHDGQLIPLELDLSKADLLQYLRANIHLTLNGKATLLPTSAHFQPLWPNSTLAVGEADFATRHLDLSFECEANPVLDNLGIKFTLWKEAGTLATIEATFEQEDFRTQIPFSMNEPDYVYHTGYGLDDLFQPPQTKLKEDDAGLPSWIMWTMVFMSSGVMLMILRRLISMPS
jgi:hypothetical protein